MNNYDYKELTPFKWFVLENFPFLEADFDALTNWQLFCKLGKEINKIINSQNTVGKQTEDLTTAFNNLKNYVDNYFNNLDVQDEINNKLDVMAQSGELTEIIAQYLQLAGLLCYNTVADMKNATNIVNGSFVKTFGLNIYNDGMGEFYKIRNIRNDDVVDNINIIAINKSDILIAEKMPNRYIEDMQNEIKYLKNKKYIFLGDSYGTGQNELGEQTIPWTTLVPQYLGLSNNDYIANSSNGSGFNHGKTFLAQLQEVANTITNKNEITDIVIVGGYNDRYHTINVIKTAMNTFFNYAKTTFPRAKLKLAEVGWSRVYDTRQSIANNSLPAYTQCGQYGCQYLKNTEFILHDYSLFSGDKYHPNQNGQNELAKYLTDAILNGSCEVIRSFVTPTNKKSDNVTEYNPNYILESQHNGIITFMANIGYIRMNPTNIGNRTVVPLIDFEDGLILGGGLSIFRQYMQIFTANSSSQFIKLMGCFALQYNANDDVCFLAFVNQADNVNHQNITELNTDTIFMQLPALYV